MEIVNKLCPINLTTCFYYVYQQTGPARDNVLVPLESFVSVKFSDDPVLL